MLYARRDEPKKHLHNGGVTTLTSVVSEEQQIFAGNLKFFIGNRETPKISRETSDNMSVHCKKISGTSHMILKSWDDPNFRDRLHRYMVLLKQRLLEFSSPVE